MRRWLVVVACCAFSLFSSALFSEDIKSLVRVRNLSKNQIVKLLQQGYDIPSQGDNFIEIVIDKNKVKNFTNQGYPVEFIIEDLNAYIKNVQAQQTKTDQYYTFQTATSQMKKWAEEYSHICRLESIGKSIEDRDIWALKLSDNPELDEPEPAALIMGMHHSREWPSVEVPMATIKLLLEEYGHNEKFTELVNSREIWFVPIVNPDGFIYSQEQSRYWRKNRRKNSGGTYGVDLNRNYGYQWGNVGASSSGYSDTYHGTGPFSEPESQAIRDFALRERFQASISFHTYSELILFPFGYGYNVPNPDRKVFEKMASDMAEFNKYRPQNSAELYPAMGDCDDYLYGELKVLSFTFELCRTFIPSASQIDQVNSLNVPAVLYLIEKAGTYGLISPSGDDEIVENLEFNDALAALTDIVMLFDRENNIAMRNEVLNRIERLSLKTAQLVVDDLNKGKTDSWELLKEVNQAALASSYVRNRVLFNQAHGQKYSEYILNEFKK